MNASLGAPLHVAEITLAARAMAPMRGFYEQGLGLSVIEEGPGFVALGAGGRALVRLLDRPEAAPEDPRSAGLFHLAVLLPGRGDLARWLRHAAATGLAIDGASDHGVSEAVYLSDPEGNGVEVYVDRAPEAWPRAAGGALAMTTAPLDMAPLSAALAADPSPWTGAPDGTVIGHVHLRVGDVAAAKAFYAGALGLEHTQDYPGAAFFASGGYHHHVGANAWRSRGAGRRAEGRAGLSETVFAADAETLGAIRARLQASGAEVTPQGEGFAVDDPWGLRLGFRASA